VTPGDQGRAQRIGTDFRQASRNSAVRGVILKNGDIFVAYNHLSEHNTYLYFVKSLLQTYLDKQAYRVEKDLQIDLPSMEGWKSGDAGFFSVKNL